MYIERKGAREEHWRNREFLVLLNMSSVNIHVVDVSGILMRGPSAINSEREFQAFKY